MLEARGALGKIAGASGVVKLFNEGDMAVSINGGPLKGL